MDGQHGHVQVFISCHLCVAKMKRTSEEGPDLKKKNPVNDSGVEWDKCLFGFRGQRSDG